MTYVPADVCGDLPLAVRNELWITALRARLVTEASAMVSARARQHARTARWMSARSKRRRQPRRLLTRQRGRVLPFRRPSLALSSR